MNNVDDGNDKGDDDGYSSGQTRLRIAQYEALRQPQQQRDGPIDVRQNLLTKYDRLSDDYDADTITAEQSTSSDDDDDHDDSDDDIKKDDGNDHSDDSLDDPSSTTIDKQSSTSLSDEK